MYRIAYGHPGVGLLGWLFFAAFVALLVVGVMAVVQLWRRPGRMRPGPGWYRAGPGWDPALQELRMRYARGEIGWDEYLRRSADLGFHPPTAPPPGTPGWGGPGWGPPGTPGWGPAGTPGWGAPGGPPGPPPAAPPATGPEAPDGGDGGNPPGS